MTDALRHSILVPSSAGLACWVEDLKSSEFNSVGWCELLGLPSEPSCKSTWYDLVHEEDRAEVEARVSALATETVTNGIQLECRAATDGDFRWMQFRVQQILDANDRPVRVVLTAFDATLMRSLQQEMLGTSPVESVAKSAPILMWTTDTNGRCEWFNQRWLDFTGNTLESALVAGRCGTAHPDDREHALSAFKSAFELRDSIELEYRLHHHDGTYRWVLDRSAPRFEGGEFNGYVGVCLDITHEYEYRQRLADREQMLARLHQINEGERMFLSCAIHDGILQDIIGADMLLQNAEQLEPDKLAAKLDLAHKTIHSAIRHGRRLISELRPMILDEQGLVSAIEYFAAELENRGSVAISVASEFAEEVMCPLWGGNVFRIVQTAMNNVEAHSQSDEASIAISSGPDNQFCVVVRDNGVGFDLEAQRESFGLRCMRERAELYGGSVEFESTPGNGCVVKILVPLPPR